MLKALCDQKKVPYSDAETEAVLEKLTRGQPRPDALTFEQFRVFFSTALSYKDVDLSQSLMAEALEVSQIARAK